MAVVGSAKQEADPSMPEKLSLGSAAEADLSLAPEKDCEICHRSGEVTVSLPLRRALHHFCQKAKWVNLILKEVQSGQSQTDTATPVFYDLELEELLYCKDICETLDKKENMTMD